MCGIAGFIGSQNEAAALNVSQSLAHRGPDSGVVSYLPDVRLNLVHRRLAVLDLESGDQPMWNGDGTIGVVFNGEIYNHAALRVELEALGHRFSTDHSDTECLIHGYAQWGSDLAQRLNGMFAFAIIDLQKNKLYFARDRFGEKPLYILQTPEHFAFASEVQAFEQMPGIGLDVSRENLIRYFSFGFFPGTSCLFEHVQKLKAGEHVLLDLNNLLTNPWRDAVRSYWSFDLQSDEDHFRNRSDENVAEEFWSHFTTAVERRLISDVPIGLFLSGGLDSSAVLAAMTEKIPRKQIDCFTIGFTEKSFDESSHAEAVASHFGVRHHIRRFDMATALDSADRVLGQMREPLADASILPTELLAGFARESVTVAITGDGGDELLAGYDPFLALRFAKFCSAFAMPFTTDLVRHLVRLLPKKDTYMSLDFKLARFLEGISEPRPLWEPVWMAPLPPREVMDAFGIDANRDVIFEDVFKLYEKIISASTLDQALSYFTNFYLTDNILVKSDRAAMMSSLETRAVFLDNDLVDFISRLPGRYKLRGNNRKFILKEAVRGKIPQQLIERRKQGFGIPLSKWLRETPIAQGENRVPFLNDSFLSNAINDHMSQRKDGRLFLFSWLAAQKALN